MLADKDNVLAKLLEGNGVAEPTPKHIVLLDPLSEITREARRNLLASSIVAIAIAKAGLVPTKISTIGIEFAQLNKSAVLWVLGAIVFYFLFAFALYAMADFAVWRMSYYDTMAERVRSLNLLKMSQEDRDALKTTIATKAEHSFYRDPVRFYRWFAKPVALLRPLFDFVVPILTAGFAIYSLWQAGIYIG